MAGKSTSPESPIFSGASAVGLSEPAEHRSVIDDVVGLYAEERRRRRSRLLRLMQVFASLKLTVVLFALAIFIVFAGTLAQTRHDIWYVVHNYFRTAVAWIDFQVFFPQSFFPHLPPIPGKFPFPGGWLIGAAMAVNLLAAHAVRFTTQARGARLFSGLAVIGLGVLVTGLVIASGSSEGLQGVPFFDWSSLWMVLKVSLAALCAAGIWWAMQLEASRALERNALLGACGALGALVVWLFVEGDAVALGDSSMRILWQLVQGTFAGGVLLAGCWLAFGKRAGIVLLHGGIGLLMFSELLVGTTAIEGQMHIREGDTARYVDDIRSVELAFIDSTDLKDDQVVVVPQSLLKSGAEIAHEDLPFDVRVVRFLQNADVRMAKPGDENPATVGLGQEMFAEEAAAGVGASSSSQVDESAVYVELRKKGSGESLGTWLLSLLQSRLQESRERSGLAASEVRSQTGPFVLKLSEPTVVEVDGKPYHVSLRFKRMYRPYSIKLLDVHTEYYPGTTTPKDYSSTVRLVAPEENVDREVRVWMNNPLRFGGETFYQSSVGADPITGDETTGLQVVTNKGWMIPYVSCMIVGVGMLFQFGLTLLRFLQRRASGAIAVAPVQPKVPGRAAPSRVTAPEFTLDQIPRQASLVERFLPLALIVICGLALIRQAMPPKPAPDGFDLYAAGKIPILYQGRLKPLDTLARNTLQVISDKETFKDENNARQPAIRWLLDVISLKKAAEDHRVFRIDNFEVLDLLGLRQREGFLYSVEEIRKRSAEFHAEVDKVRKKPAESLSVYERKLLNLDQRVRSFTAVDATFRRPELPPQPGTELREKFQGNEAALKKQLADAEARLISQGHPPLVVPVRVAGGGSSQYEWKPYVSAWTLDYFESAVFEERPPDATIAGLEAVLSAWREGKAEGFNQAVSAYKAILASESPPQLDFPRTSYEAYFNHFSPFFQAWILYIAGFAIAAMAWLAPTAGWSRTINRTAFWLMLFTLGVHTFALISRIYISGRPPVTNLYASAVFIGWGCVAVGLILERVFQLGIGNVISAVAGFATLFISFKLAGDGDTFTVLQAVLDTQFWLATHVTCITMGYATTFLSGLLGVFYVLRGVFTPTLDSTVGKSLARMIYGTLCFAIFFSFVGTVLGGLWADDSWGRFWGWDPKENGALMIVLWNALVLHARWDGMVKDRGLAVLAIGGNIVTAWSWFGVNELGKGLHAYGFRDGMLAALGVFVFFQLVVIAIGMRPKEYWWSRKAEPASLT